MTDARTIRALYCNELEMSAGHEQRAAMHRPHNRQMRQGETGTRAQRLRSGATRVHGGEHGSSPPLGGAALLAAQRGPHRPNRFQLRVLRLAASDLQERRERRAGLLRQLNKLSPRQTSESLTHIGGGWDCVFHAAIIPLAVRLSTSDGIFVDTVSQ